MTRPSVCALTLLGVAVLARLLGGAELAAPSEYLVCGSRVWTMAAAPLEGGCVHVRDGRVASVAPRAPAGSTLPVLDYPGSDILPGLVDGHTHLALKGDPRRAGEHNERFGKVLPELRIIDGFDPYDASIVHARSGGVTTAVVVPGSIPIVSGQAALVKLKPPPLSNMLLKSLAGVKASSWQKETYDELDKWLSTPADDEGSRLAREVLAGKVPLIVHGAYPSGEIEPVLALSDKHGVRLILYHCESCDENFEELLVRRIPIVLGPRLLYWNRDRSTNLASFLVRHGLEVAISSDASEGQSKYLLEQAGLAVHYGMEVEEALRAITITPARIFGVDDRVGSIEPGKDADLVVLSGPVFAARTKVLLVLIEGVTLYEEKQR